MKLNEMKVVELKNELEAGFAEMLRLREAMESKAIFQINQRMQQKMQQQTQRIQSIKMASTSEDENVVQGRRTRSGRKASAPTPVVPTTRSTRRTSKKLQNAFDEVHENEQGLENIMESDVVPELESDPNNESVEENGANTELDEVTENLVEENEEVAEDAPEDVENVSGEIENNTDEVENVNEEVENINEHDEKSSSFPFGDIPSEVTSTLFEQSSADKEDNSFFANLAAEENANSLPSATDDTREDSGQGADNENVEMSAVDSEPVKENTENMDVSDNIEMIAETTTEVDLDEVAVLADSVIVDEINENSGSDDNAVIEDLPNGGNTDATEIEPDTEMVSEDELPTPTKPKVQGTKEVSDEELPGPKLAELPADTEVVSEDELPSSTKKDTNKRKAEDYDPNSPTETPDLPEKKAKTEEQIVAPDPEVEKKKKLPELDKYWKAVNDDPADFTGWTYLLQYVDQENDVDAAREAYDAFLAHYPYCYGYWRKYADYEKRKGNKKKCEEVFERGLKAIPLSVDLWIHYLSHVKTNYNDDESFIRVQFERAIEACGLEFRSDKLWEAYIKWESDRKRWLKVVDIYDRLLATPTQGYNSHFDSFSEVVNVNPVASLISCEEIKRLRTEVRDSLGPKEKPVKEKSAKDAKPVKEEKSIKEEKPVKEDKPVKVIVQPSKDEAKIDKTPEEEVVEKAPTEEEKLIKTEEGGGAAYVTGPEDESVGEGPCAADGHRGEHLCWRRRVRRGVSQREGDSRGSGNRGPLIDKGQGDGQRQPQRRYRLRERDRYGDFGKIHRHRDTDCQGGSSKRSQEDSPHMDGGIRTQPRRRLSRKFQLGWRGPYKVIKQINEVIYRTQRGLRGKTGGGTSGAVGAL